LVKKAVECAKKLNVPTITAGGGVVANSYLRETLTAECSKAGIKLVLPARAFCTDNAAMIAAEGLNLYLAGKFATMDINARAAIPLK
jgi:N6-L-threonylcarbamoyladenine synthase